MEQALPLQAIRSQPDETKTAGEPTALRFKGLTLIPGGFLDSTALVRSRNENADMATSYSTIPLDGSSNANLSELRGTARTSQLSLLIQTALREHNITGIYRSRLPRSIPNRELRPIQFLDSTLAASLDASRVAVGMDGHCRSNVVAADDAPTRHGQSRGTETARSRCQSCGGVHLDTGASRSRDQELQQSRVGRFRSRRIRKVRIRRLLCRPMSWG